MKKASLWIAILSLLFAILPILCMLAAGGIATLLGCPLDESGTASCLTPLGDIGGLLSTMGIFGWLVFFTVPIGFVGILIALLLFVFARILERRKAREALPRN